MKYQHYEDGHNNINKRNLQEISTTRENTVKMKQFTRTIYVQQEKYVQQEIKHA